MTLGSTPTSPPVRWVGRPGVVRRKPGVTEPLDGAGALLRVACRGWSRRSASLLAGVDSDQRDAAVRAAAGRFGVGSVGELAADRADQLPSSRLARAVVDLLGW
jgi:hypothetical protein